MSDASTQTDPVLITSSGSSAPVDPSVADVWSRSDEDAQAEAIRTIQQLSQRKSDTSAFDRRIADLEEMLNRERTRGKELEAVVIKERQRSDALQQQVLCQEAEMDSKESALQAQHRIIDRDSQYSDNVIGSRAMQTQPALPQVGMGSTFRSASPLSSFSRRNMGRSLSPNAARLGGGYPESHVLRAEADLLAARRSHLLERDVKLDAKDQQISQLLRELRQAPDAPQMADLDPHGGYMSHLNMTAPSFNYGLRR